MKDQEDMKCYLFFVLKGQVRKVPPWMMRLSNVDVSSFV